MIAPRIPLATVLAALLATSGWAAITPLLSDDFEGGTPVGAVETEDYNPPGWTVTESVNRSVQVYASTSSAGMSRARSVLRA